MASNSETKSGCLMAAGIFVTLFSFGLFSDSPGAGIFFLIIAIILIVTGVKGLGVSSTGPPPPTPPLPNSNPQKLQLKVTTKADRIEHLPVKMLEFHIKGMFSAHHRIARPCFEFRMDDVTDSLSATGDPVLCVIDNLQVADSSEFQFKQNFPDPLNPGSGSMEWVKFGGVPIEVLVFPQTGNRRIQVSLSVKDLATGHLVASAKTVWSTLVEGSGYLESETEESNAQCASLQLAMCIAAADGTIDDEEVTIIKNWGEKSVKALPETRRMLRHEALNEALSNATQQIRAGRLSILEDDAIEALKIQDEPRFLYDAYELCLNVLKADGEAHPSEMAQLTRISKRLGLDEARIRILTDRHLAGVDFKPAKNSFEDDQILGITEDLSKEEIRKHLNKLFKKHEARTQHSDPEVIRKSREWLDRIAKARVRHVG